MVYSGYQLTRVAGVGAEAVLEEDEDEDEKDEEKDDEIELDKGLLECRLLDTGRLLETELDTGLLEA